MNRKTVFVSVTCAAVVSLIAVWVAQNDSQKRIDASVADVDVAQRTKATASTADSRTLAKLNVDSESSSTLAKRMLTAPNMRAFVEEVKQHPEKGGVFLAETAVMHCKQAQVVTNKQRHDEVLKLQIARHPEREKFLAQAIAAADQVSARCQGFTQEDYASLELMSGKLGQGRAPDPAIEASKALRNANKEQVWSFDRAQEIARVYSSVGSFSATGAYVFATKDAENSSKAVLYLEGKPVDGYAREALIGAQAVVSYYETGRDNPQSIHALSMCAFELRCDPMDTQEKLIQLAMDDSYYSTTKLDRDVLRAQIAQLVPKLQHAVSTGDFSMFAPPSKARS